MSRRLMAILLVALLGVVVSGALWATRGNDGGSTALVDESTGSYRGVAMGDDEADVRRRLGSAENGPGFSPAGQLPADAGVPQSIPGFGQILKYDDVAFLLGARGVYAFIVTKDGAATTRGIQIGDDVDEARRAYATGCIEVAGGESLVGGQEFYPSCRATIEGACASGSAAIRSGASPSCRFATWVDQSSHRCVSTSDDTSIGSRAVKVGVVGLGTMGAGIAQVALQSGDEVVGREVSDELGTKALERIAHFLARAVDKGRMSGEECDAALARLTTTTELDDLSGCELVIEAIVEELEPKRELFRELDRICAPDAILATNTSALSVSDIAAATERPERVVGMHFFNPAPVLPLVEVVRTEQSDEVVVGAAYAWCERAGKQPVRCNDTPGFIVNRILIPLLNDCVRVLDEARVSPEDLDKAMTNGAGWPMGPCALLDLIGIDVHVHASEALHEKVPEDRMAAPERLREMQAAGTLGRKTGRGFFEYQ